MLLVVVVVLAVAVSLISFVTRGTSLPQKVTLRQIDGGSHYYADIDPASAWMDQHIMVGAWLEQPLTAAEVGYDATMGNNIYWNLAGNPLDTKNCGGIQPCRVNFNVIRAAGMHASAPDVTSESGFETVAYEGTDEPDMNFGPGSNGWSRKRHVSQPDLSAATPWLISTTAATQPGMARPDILLAESQSPKDSARVYFSGRRRPRPRSS